jgi:uncharacterized membrane-anchored protein YhcB (DUF1043 family)
MIQFALGLLVGGAVGVVAMALVAASAPDVKDLRDELKGKH